MVVTWKLGMRFLIRPGVAVKLINLSGVLFLVNPGSGGFMPAEERRLAAIMFSDICGYSKAMEADEQRALGLVSLHNQVVQSGADQYGGRIIKAMGDGLLVEFSSAVNAVKCAVAVQESIGNYNKEVPEADRIFIRIGIHLGDVVVAGADILGDGVNVASRIEPFAEPGGICISRDILDLVSNKLEIQAVHIGAKELKNISKQVEIYKILLDAMGSGSSRPIGAQTVRQQKPGWLGSHKSRVVWISVGTILFLFLAGGVCKKAALRKTAEREYRNVTGLAERFIKSGEPGKAVAELKKYPSRFKDTPWQVQINRQIEELEPAIEEARVKVRCSAFFDAVQKEDWVGAAAFVAPTQVMELGRKNVELRLQVVGGLIVKLGKVTRENLKIGSVEIADRGKSAYVNVEVFAREPGNSEGKWHQGKPSHWILADGEWYLDVGPVRESLPPKERMVKPRLRPGTLREER